MRKAVRTLYNALPFKPALFHLVKKVYVPQHHIYRHLHFKGVFSVQVDDKAFRLQHFGYEIENDLFWKGIRGWEGVSLEYWLRLAQISTTIADVGANTGIYSIAAKTVQPTAQVHAFEPLSQYFDHLKVNCELNNYNDIHCHQIALSNQSGEAVIAGWTLEDGNRDDSEKNMMDDTSNPRLVIQTQMLDDLVAQEKMAPPDLLKIDVETHEPQVLEGMRQCLATTSPSMIIEVLSDEIGAKIESLIGHKNYLYFDIDEKSPPRHVDCLRQSSHYNYLICTPEIAKQLDLKY